MFVRRFIPTIALLLSGCAGAHENYPSLARRPIETAPIAEVVPPPPPAVASDPKLDADIARLKAQADKGGAAFDTAYARAGKLASAAANAAVSSDAWVAAQQAISNLESARNDSVSALASLDTLYVQRTNAVADGKAQGGVDSVDAARAAVLSIVDRQNDRVDALKGRLKQP